MDDEDTLVDLGGKTLERLGYQTTTFTSSTAALEHFRAHPDDIDLVITDYTMPRMTGLGCPRNCSASGPTFPSLSPPVSAVI